MCGRTACTLDPQDVRRACTYTNRNGRRVRPRWRNPGQGGGGAGGGGGTNTGGGQMRKHTIDGKQQASDENQNMQHKPKKYWPSFNMSPTQVLPVLVSSNHFKSQQSETESKETQTGERELCPMQWGLVPQWHKGDPKSVSYKMNNCRSEGMMDRVTFKRPFEKGRRCVVLADGFYEWKTDKEKKSKQPYFIYFKQDKPVSDLHINDETGSDAPPEQEDKEVEEEMEGQEWGGHRLLTMAGLFDVWRPADGGEPLYTFTVITIESHQSFSWIHHRMPAMLDGEEAVRSWLDYGRIPHKQAMSLIKPTDCLAWHPVTTQVGNSRYKEANCVKPIELGKPIKSGSSNLMASWLKKASNKTSTNSQEENKQSNNKTPANSQESISSTPPNSDESTTEEKRGTKRSQPSPAKPNPMMAWLKKANSDEKLQKVTGGPPTPKKSKTR